MKAAFKSVLGTFNGSKSDRDHSYRESSSATMVYVGRRRGVLQSLCGCGYSNSCTASFMGATYLELPLSIIHLPEVVHAAPDHQQPAVVRTTSFVSVPSDGPEGDGASLLEPAGSSSSSRSSQQYAAQLGAVPEVELAGGSDEFLELDPVPSNGQQLRRCLALPTRPIAAEMAAAAAAGTGSFSQLSSRQDSHHTSAYEAVLVEEQAADCGWRQHEAFRLAWQMASMQHEWSGDEHYEDNAMQLHEHALMEHLESPSIAMFMARQNTSQRPAVIPAAEEYSLEDWKLFGELPDLHHCSGHVLPNTLAQLRANLVGQ